MDAIVTAPLLNDDDDQQDLQVFLQQKSFKGGWKSSIYIIRAVVADSYLGCFKTILISTLIYLTGLVLLTISVSAIPLGYQHVLFFFSIYIGLKPCLLIFGADQFDDVDPEEKKEKSSFFNWWYFGVCGGGSTAFFTMFYVQDNVGWTIGFGIPAIAMAIAFVIFLFGRRGYRQQVPAGSPLTRVVQVFVAAARKHHLSADENGEFYEESKAQLGLRGGSLTRTDQFKCLDKAMIIDDVDLSSKTRNKWRLCSVTQVEEAKLLLQLIPIWLSCLMYTITMAQSNTFFVKQGSTMNGNIGSYFQIPPASLQASTGLAAMIVVPIYDRILVPAARNITGFPSGIKILQRIGIGIFLSIINMIVAALVEARRIRIATDHGLLDQPNATIPMSIWWLLPQYAMFGASDVFMIVGLQELFYDQMPYGMRSMGLAVYISIAGCGNILSSVVISIVQWMSSRGGDEWLGINLNRAHLDYYYWLLAGLSALLYGVYICVAKCFVYKKVFCNQPCKTVVRDIPSRGVESWD